MLFRSQALWRELRDVSFFADGTGSQVWRISVAPTRGAGVAGELERKLGGRLYMDWGGGLIWLEIEPSSDGGHRQVRAATGDGHATLVRAAEEVRATVPVFQPQPPALAALNMRIEESFNPRRILNPGRMVQGQ